VWAETDDMKAVSVEANFPQYDFVDREALLEMAGVHAPDPEWVGGFER